MPGNYTGYLGDSRNEVNNSFESRFLREDTKVLSTTDFQNSLDQTRLDITDQILRYNQLYGASDSTQPNSLSASKSLNYAKAPTLQQAQQYRIQTIPFTLNFQNSVGLFGSENMYVRVDIDVERLQDSCDIRVGDYFEACLGFVVEGTVNSYQEAQIDPLQDTPGMGNINNYAPAIITENLPFVEDGKVRIDVNNLKTGNIYIDNWLDVMLYTKKGEMWGFDTIYLNPKDSFYIGFHARNTRRLPFNVDAVIGEELVPEDEIKDKELIGISYQY